MLLIPWLIETFDVHVVGPNLVTVGGACLGQLSASLHMRIIARDAWLGLICSIIQSIIVKKISTASAVFLSIAEVHSAL